VSYNTRQSRILDQESIKILQKKAFLIRLQCVYLACLTLPISNALVEQTFATVTLTKIKLMNRMKLMMQGALLHIKTNLSFEK